MNNFPDCPTDVDLRRFLDDTLESTHRVELHVSECYQCIERLDLMTRELEAEVYSPLDREMELGRDDTEADFSFEAFELPAQLLEIPTPDEVGNSFILGTADPDDSTAKGFQTLAMPDFADSRFLHFELKWRIAAGSQGVLYRAVDTRLERDVAIKFFRQAGPTNLLVVSRMMREARSLAALNHSGIVSIYDAAPAVDNYPPYLVMELIDGQSLRQVMRNPGHEIGHTEAARIVRDAAEALHAAHSRGIIHRDVKPANVMIVRDTNAVVMTDFGLASDISADSDWTVDGAVAGTPCYMSPEHLLNPEAVNARSDIYSLGAMLYELLTGQPPFRGSTKLVLTQLLHESPRSPRAIDPSLPRDLETICLKALSAEPGDRFEDAQQLADDLTRWIEHRPIQSRPIGVVGRLQRWRRRSPQQAIFVTLIIGLLSIVAAGGWAFSLQLAAARDRANDATRVANSRLQANGQLLELALESTFRPGSFALPFPREDCTDEPELQKELLAKLKVVIQSADEFSEDDDRVTKARLWLVRLLLLNGDLSEAEANYERLEPQIQKMVEAGDPLTMQMLLETNWLWFARDQRQTSRAHDARRAALRLARTDFDYLLSSLYMRTQSRKIQTNASEVQAGQVPNAASDNVTIHLPTAATMDDTLLLIQELLADVDARSPSHHAIELSLLAGDLQLRRGNIDEAKGHFRVAADSASHDPDHVYPSVTAARRLAELHLQRKDFESARSVIDAAIDRLLDLSDPMEFEPWLSEEQAALAQLDGELEIKLGNEETGLDCFDESMFLLEQIAGEFCCDTSLWQLAHCKLRYAELLTELNIKGGKRQVRDAFRLAKLFGSPEYAELTQSEVAEALQMDRDAASVWDGGSSNDPTANAAFTAVPDRSHLGLDLGRQPDFFKRHAFGNPITPANIALLKQRSQRQIEVVNKSSKSSKENREVTGRDLLVTEVPLRGN